jgi:hypothetical protein
MDIARQSAPSLWVVGRGITVAREALVGKWSEWIVARQAAGQVLEPCALARPLGLILDLLVHMTGPLRREAKESWYAATELYGRLAEARGLSAGEVVDELQRLRELLIRELADLFVALPARQQLLTIVRMSRVLDMAVSNAVVGYTDALVAKMFSREGVPVPTADSVQELLAQFHALEPELKLLEERLPR